MATQYIGSGVSTYPGQVKPQSVVITGSRFPRERGNEPNPNKSGSQSRFRRGNSTGGTVAPAGAAAVLGGRCVGGQWQQLNTDPRYYGATNDDRIFRDNNSFLHKSAGVSGAGTVSWDWDSAGPARPELHSRSSSYRRMAGTDQTRFFADPRDPSIGLHSNPKARPSGNLARYQSGGSAMQPGRTDRLSPARYSGQSYSQTTLEQGVRERKVSGRRVAR